VLLVTVHDSCRPPELGDQAAHPLLLPLSCRRQPRWAGLFLKGVNVEQWRSTDSPPNNRQLRGTMTEQERDSAPMCSSVGFRLLSHSRRRSSPSSNVRAGCPGQCHVDGSEYHRTRTAISTIGIASNLLVVDRGADGHCTLCVSSGNRRSLCSRSYSGLVKHDFDRSRTQRVYVLSVSEGRGLISRP